MSDVKDPPSSLEDICAGLLNGTMVTLLGGVVPGLIVWQVVAQLSGWLLDLQAMTVDLPPADFNALSSHERRDVIQDSVSGVPVLIASFWAIRWGVGHIRENLALLRARRS